MSKKGAYTEYKKNMTLSFVIINGIIIFILSVLIAGKLELARTERMAADTLDTLKSQCAGYERLVASERAKSLFVLLNSVQDFSRHLGERDEPVTDAYLERHVDSMRLTGIAVLDEKLRLQASGYTRQFRDSDWMDTADGSRYADILEYPEKVFVERVEADGEFYDVCAVARTDAPGIVIGYYKQPAGMITNTEDDLKSLLTGLKLDRQGEYIITQRENVRASSDPVIKDHKMSENDRLYPLTQLKKDGHLHLFYSGTRYYWGCQDGFAGYKLYVYYPLWGPISPACMATFFVVVIYAVVYLLLFAVRNRVLLENQTRLQQTNSELTETVNILKSLETIYFALFYVDLTDDTYKTISVSSYLSDIIPREGAYSKLRELFIETMMTPSYREAVGHRMSREFIQSTLNRNNFTDVRKSIYIDFEAIREGQPMWCRASATVVDFDEAGRPLRILALLQDVDKEKAKEAAYKNRILDESQKARMANQAKSDFLRRISHDIRTPLNGIRGYIDMASYEPENSTLQGYCREKARVALNNLYELVNSVLEMSDMEGREVQVESLPFDLGTLLCEVSTVIKPQAIAKNISCEILPQSELPASHLIGSPRHVNQILMNLASNGVKFGKENGWLHLDVKTVSQTDGEVTYEFVFEDNGIGMGEEFQKHIYEPFVQENSGARTTYEGTGLGLAIVKKLVDALGGTISFESKKDVGTTFHVKLTFRIDQTYCAPITEDALDDTQSREDLRVLLVEDNELNMEIAGFILEERGIQITKAWNGFEAVDLFAQSQPGEYNVILMDIMMPEMNGLEATAAIRGMDRADAKTIPIIAMSANAFQEDVQKSLDAGMNGHIPKPIEPKQLWAVLKKCTG